MAMHRFAALLLVALLAACGDDSDTPPQAEDGAAPPAAASAAATATQPPEIAAPAPAVTPAEPIPAPATPEPAPVLDPTPAAPAQTPPPPAETPAAAAPVAPASPAPPPAGEVPGPATTPAAAPEAAVAVTPPAEAVLPAPVDEAALLAAIGVADAAAGEVMAAAQCGPCHRMTPDGGTLIGPPLYEIVGAAVGRTAGFNYSPALRALNTEGATWTFIRLDAFLADPALAIPGTRMGVGGIEDQRARANVIAYLRSLAATPVPLAGARLPMIPEGLGPVTMTAEQVDFGRDLYGRFCSRCHGVNLLGLINENEWGEAPNLIGATFVNHWYSGPVYELFAMITTLLVDEAHGGGVLHGNLGIADERYAQIIAYILSQNGFQPGPTPLPFDEAGLRGLGFYQQP